MRVQPKLFGGSEVRGPSAKRADQLVITFGADSWLDAAQDWCRVNGLDWVSWTVGQSFQVGGGVWYVAAWNEAGGVWEFDRLA